MSGYSTALTETLALVVPLWIDQFRGLSPQERQEIAGRAGQVIGAQGDTLMFGSSRSFGHGAKEMAAHREHGDGRDPGGKCRVCTAGQPSYSAGEVLGELARGLACGAFQPGGIRFAGLSWCAAHPRQRWTDGVICPACLSEEQEAARA